jgi:hypothetical protein
MPTVLELINMVLLRTGQLTVTTIINAATPVAQTLNFANSILVEMYLQLNSAWLFEKETLTTTNGVASYNLPTGVEADRLLDCTIGFSGDLTPFNQIPLKHTSKFSASTTGKPSFFWLQEGKLFLWPTPNAAYTLDFLYKPMAPTLASNTQVVDVPQAWMETLLLGTQAYLERFLGESGSAADSFTLYQNKLNSLKTQSPHSPKKRFKSIYKGSKNPTGF